MAKKGRVFLRGMTSEKYGLKEFRTAQLAAPRVRDDSVVDRRRQGRPLRRLRPVPDLVAGRARRRPVPDPDPAGALRPAAAAFLQRRSRPPERGGLLHPRRQRLRDPRRPALRLGQGRPGAGPHRLGPPPLQPLRRAGHRAGHEGQVRLDVPGPDPAGPERPDSPTRTSSGRARTGPRSGPRACRSAGRWSSRPTPCGRPPRWAGSGCCPPRRPPTCARSAWTASSWRSRRAAGPASAGTWPTRCSTCWAAPATACTGRSRPSWTRSTTPGSPRSPTRHEITAGDTLYVPQNTIAQHFSADGQPLRLLSGQNRLFKQLGYDRVAYLENAPEFGAQPEAVRV